MFISLSYKLLFFQIQAVKQRSVAMKATAVKQRQHEFPLS